MLGKTELFGLKDLFGQWKGSLIAVCPIAPLLWWNYLFDFEVKLHTLVPPWQATPLSLIDSYNTKQSYLHICHDGLSFGKTACLPVTGVLNGNTKIFF